MTTKHELLEVCAKATGRTGTTVPVFGANSMVGLRLMDGAIWSPLDDDGDCARMEEQMRVSVSWGAIGVQTFFTNGRGGYERYADHPTPQAARRYASCRAVAAMKGKQNGNT